MFTTTDIECITITEDRKLTLQLHLMYVAQ